MKGFSTTDVSARLIDRITQVKKTLPPGTTIDVIKNAGERVDRAVLNVEESLLLGALLTVLVVFLFLNSWRSTGIPCVALPISAPARFIPVPALALRPPTISPLRPSFS